MMILHTGCTTKDEVAPVITSVKVEGNVVKIEATDNVGVTGYISVSNPRQPSLTDEYWQESNSITLDEDGTYYVWVKDASDNLAQYTETIEISYNLAQKFDHLNWLTPAEGTRVVDGVTYNLAELKAEYGDLYRFVEPLTNEEIERRFAYLAEFIELQMQEGQKAGFYNWYPESGLKMSGEVSSILYKSVYPLIEELMNSKDVKLELFKQMYFYVSSTGLYETRILSSFTSLDNNWGLSRDIVDKIPFDDKDIFLRDIMLTYEMQLKAYAQLGLEPEYVIESWDWD